MPRLLDHFEHDGPNGKHCCLVMEVLGDSVGMFARRVFPRNQLPRGRTQNFIVQLLSLLDFLHQICGYTHTGKAPSHSLLTVDIDAKNLLLELPGPMSADFAKTNHGPSEAASWARFQLPEQPFVIPGSSARILESQPIQANVAEEQYTIKLIGLGHGNALP